MMMSLRADFFGELQKDEALYAVHRQINVPPLRETELRKVLSRPAEMLSARFESPALLDIITRRAAEDSVKDVGALPLLSYTLDDMWTHMVKAGDGVLRLPAKAFELGGVLVDRADKFLATHPGAENALRRILTLRLATVREDGEPTRRRAPRSEFSDEEWRLVSELADHPNRLLVTARSESGEHYAEVAHEAIFRRWDKLRDWIGGEREFLAWRNGLEAACRAWQATTEGSKNDALLMGAGLTQARSWMERRGDDLTAVDRQFIDKSAFRDSKARRTALHVRAVIYFLLIGIIVGLVGWINQSYIKDELNWFITMRPYMLENVRPYVLTAEAERAPKPQATFRECAKDCPEMVVIPSGRFSMGSPADEQGRFDNEGPQHEVFIDKPFAVSKFDVTFAEWDACVSVGGCLRANDSGMGRGTKPVINVNWLEAQQYVTWLSNMTGKPYRLLTEAEWEYVARGGTGTAYFWGDDIGRGNANCNGCGSQWDGKQSSPIGSFAPNDFRLYDMAGNVWQWVQDCYHDDYAGAPTDGSAWISGDCSRRVGRGGSWFLSPQNLRAAYRDRSSADSRVDDLGFRVARMLTP
jgi:formylglycine-generating enzyme required for sulfatase activity